MTIKKGWVKSVIKYVQPIDGVLLLKVRDDYTKIEQIKNYLIINKKLLYYNRKNKVLFTFYNNVNPLIYEIFNINEKELLEEYIKLNNIISQNTNELCTLYSIIKEVKFDRIKINNIPSLYLNWFVLTQLPCVNKVSPTVFRGILTYSMKNEKWGTIIDVNNLKKFLNKTFDPLLEFTNKGNKIYSRTLYKQIGGTFKQEVNSPLLIIRDETTKGTRFWNWYKKFTNTKI